MATGSILAYTVGQAEILETPGLEQAPAVMDHPVFTRTLNIGRSPHELRLRVAPEGTAVALAGSAGQGQARLLARDGSIMLVVPAAVTPLKIKLMMARGESARLEEFARQSAPPEVLDGLTRGSPARWPERLPARAAIGRDDGPFAVDVLPVPESNPWLCQLRLSGFDFLAGGRQAAVCTWDGDVWLVDGLDRPEKGLTWRRIASGLFQPLGLKVEG